MIRSIQLINVENHKNTKLELSEGSNVITGPSDSGKSVFERSFEAVAYRGDFSVNDESERGEIIITTDEHTISRVRVEEMERKTCPNCKHKIQEIVTTCPECGERIKRKMVDDYYIIDGVRNIKAGIEIPQEVSDILNCKKLDVTDKNSISINFFPKNAPFSLVDLSPRERVGLLGNIAESIVMIDSKNVRVNKEHKDVLQDIKFNQRLLKDNQKIIQSLSYLDDLKPMYEKIVYFEKKLEEGNIKICILKDLIEKMKESESKIERLSVCKDVKPIEIDNKISDKIDLIRKIQSNKNRLEKIKFIKDIKPFEIRMEKEANLYSKIKTNDISHLDKILSIKPLQIKSNDEIECYSNLSKKKNIKEINFPEPIKLISNDLFILQEKIKENQKLINSSCKDKQDALLLIIRDAEEQLKHFDVCPACHQKLKGK